MRFPIRLIRTTPRIDFIRLRHIGFAFTLIATATTAWLLQTRGLNFGIDFAGGVVMEMRTEKAANLSTMRALLSASGMSDVTIQHVDSDAQVMLRIRPKDATQSQAHVAAEVKQVLSAYPGTITYERVDYVGPQVGKEMIEGSLIALALGMLSIALYLWVRFEWQFGVGGILAMLHDVVLTIGFYAFTTLEFNLTSVAALLTIIGYSINDSVVIYDRVRENMRKYKAMKMGELINLSVNETLSRTILTGGTVLLALMALMGYGGEVLFGFSAAMLFGTIVGTYSSIFISALLLLYLNPRAATQTKQTASAA